MLWRRKLRRLERADREDTTDRIARQESDSAALRLHNVSVTLDDGSAVVNKADVEIFPGEKVLVAAESGTGKSTLVWAISGLWPWGPGEIVIRRGARVFLMPQQPYVPLGTLRRAAAYPPSADDVDDAVMREARASPRSTGTRTSARGLFAHPRRRRSRSRPRRPLVAP